MASHKVDSILSGNKYKTNLGVIAIKDGQKGTRAVSAAPATGKPKWLRSRTASGSQYDSVAQTVEKHSLSTVCQESHCPNIGECWNNGTATIMLMGAVCTRACKFCAVDTGNPKGFLDPTEPANTASTVELMGLRYVVLTSVDRDDLGDGGSGHYAACIHAIRQKTPGVKIEALTPDFKGRFSDVERVIDAGLDVYAQNIETVARLTHTVRDPRAGYQQTLNILAHAKAHRPDLLTKSSLMLGLGETEDEIVRTMDDLRRCGVDVLTLGQYLRPTPNHLPIDRYLHPDEFARYREIGLAKGFIEVASGPMVRSSYRADRVFENSRLGASIDQPRPSPANIIPAISIN